VTAADFQQPVGWLEIEQAEGPEKTLGYLFRHDLPKQKRLSHLYGVRETPFAENFSSGLLRPKCFRRDNNAKPAKWFRFFRDFFDFFIGCRTAASLYPLFASIAASSSIRPRQTWRATTGGGHLWDSLREAAPNHP
jgi:hypothetical protein